MNSVVMPQWLFSSYARTLKTLGSSASKTELDDSCATLLQRWNAPCRFFHNLRHLIDMLTVIDEMAESTHEVDLVRIACWYHGAVFSNALGSAGAIRGGEDAFASAKICESQLQALGVDGATACKAGDLIRSLAAVDEMPSNMDARVLSDADLAILASEPQKYREYASSVRKEFSAMPLAQYLPIRAAMIASWLGRERIFVSSYASHWESAARQNLHAEALRVAEELEGIQDFAGEFSSAPLASVPPLSSLDAGGEELSAQEPSQGEVQVEVVRKSINPYRQNQDSDLASSLESCGDLLDTMAMKKISPDQN